MTATDMERDDSAWFEWLRTHPAEVTSLDRAKYAFLAGAAHGRAEAEAQLFQVRQDLLREGVERDQARAELARVEAELRDAGKRIWQLEAETDHGYTADPRPDSAEALRRSVVDEAMAHYMRLNAAGEFDPDLTRWSVPVNPLWKACADLYRALDAATPKTAQVYPDLPESAFITTKAECDVLAERAKQRAKWGDAHDDGHEDGDLIDVAEDILLESDDRWGLRAKHPERRDQLVIAAALIVAEIERLDRAATPKPSDAVQDAAGRLREKMTGWNYSPAIIADLRAVLGALDAKGAK